MNFTIKAIAYEIDIINNLPTNQKIEKISTGISFMIEPPRTSGRFLTFRVATILFCLVNKP